jgi:serine/threonine protein kinase
MNDLAQAVAFLESINLAHGDLRPENVLLDRNRLKLSDFDYTATIGTNCEVYTTPYGRILNGNEPDQGECGTYGLLGPRTEQFALGSLYYLMNYGFEVYGDRCLTEDPREHNVKAVDLLQNMEFPKLDGNPLIDNIIDRCWHNKYVTVSELAAHTKAFFNENEKKESSEVATLLKTIHGEASIARRASDDNRDVDQNCMEEDLFSEKEFCQDLEKRGLLQVLCSGEPKQIGFPWDWYRHSL